MGTRGSCSCSHHFRLLLSLHAHGWEGKSHINARFVLLQNIQDIHNTEKNGDFENYRAYLIFAVALIACCKIVSIYSPY